MKILISNKYYYPRGGDCNYSIGLEQLLKSNGHETAFFSMQHSENYPSAYSYLFPSEIDYSNQNFSGTIKKISRPLGSAEVLKNFRLILSDFKPDIVHVNNIHTQLSPVVVREAYRHKIPVLWTLHDYKLLCPKYDCLKDNKPCEICFNKKINVLLNRCIKNSLNASILGYIEAKKWNKSLLEKYTSLFICPSEFMKQKMMDGGFKPEKLIVLNNFINFPVDNFALVQKESYYCYVGRLSHEKGVETLLKSAIKLPEYHLKVIGTGPLTEYFTKKYSCKHIEFCGYKKSDEVKEILSKSAFMVIPSEWYENNPLSIIESLCVGTPVLGADIGGIPELIDIGNNGLLFQPGNEIDLIEKIKYFWQNKERVWNYNEIRDQATERFSKEKYYNALMLLYHQTLNSLTS